MSVLRTRYDSSLLFIGWVVFPAIAATCHKIIEVEITEKVEHTSEVVGRLANTHGKESGRMANTIGVAQLCGLLVLSNALLE